MRFERNLRIAVTGAVVSALIAAVVKWQDSGIEAGLRSANHTQHCGLGTLLFCTVGAVGVIWLGWYWLKLIRAISPITARLEAKYPEHTGARSGIFGVLRMIRINELSKALVSQLDSYSGCMAEFENQIRDLQIQIRLLERQKRNTEAIIYSIRDAVIVIDEFDRLLMANEAAGKVFAFDFKSSQHKPIGELIDSGKSEFVDFLRRSRQNKVRHTKREIELLVNPPLQKEPETGSSEDGKPKTFDCIVSCVYDQRDQVCGVVAVLHNITREKEISQMKNDFVAHVSHELKTPLASITAYLEVLADGDVKDKQTKDEFYSAIQNQAKRLNRLIEDILNISRIESGLIKVKKERVSLTILAEEQLQVMKSCAEEKNIEIVGPKPIVFEQVYADRDMISQVIINLLSNAVKYTHSGGTVKIETEADEIAGVARISVTDTGVGIPEDEVKYVFDKFYRVGANKKQAKGTGLGLNLVKQIVEKVHNGRVFVASEPGTGSTFGFELPLASAELVKN